MQSLAEMDLPLMPAETPEFAADPTPFVEEARARHPWLAKSNVGGYIVHGFHAARDIIGNDEDTHPFYPGIAAFYDAEGTGWGDFMSNMMNATVGEKHRRLRMSAQSAFLPRNINSYRALMREVLSELLDEWLPKGRFDFAEFASFFPISVFCGLLGVSREIVPQIRDALETQGDSVSLDRSQRDALLAAFDVLWAFVDSAVKQREAAGGGTSGLIDTMLAARDAGMIDDTELRQNLMMFAAGGYDTSKNMLALIVYNLLDWPEVWKRCGEDIAYCRKVVNEGLRHSGIATVYRVATRDFTYDGVLIPKDTMLIVMVSMAGRDPAFFADPLTFDPERKNASQHVTFGRGEHHCIGMHLARAQIEEGLHLLAQRIALPKLAGKPEWRSYLGIWGLQTLPVEVELAQLAQ
jgi:cytochrome P450